MTLRLSRVCAEDSILHSLTRTTFDQKLIANQSIRNKISAFGREIDSAYSHLEHIIWMLEQENKQRSHSLVPSSPSSSSTLATTTTTAITSNLPAQIANLKILAGRILERTNREAQQIMGGIGYARGGSGRGARVEQISKDVRVLVIGGGSEEILSDLVVRMEVGRLLMGGQGGRFEGVKL